jgi:two-component system sensor histidine kinase YesM
VLNVKNLSIRNQIFLTYIFLLILISALFSSFIYIQTQASINRQTNTSINQALTLAETNAQTFIYDIENIIFGVQTNGVILDALLSDSEELDRRLGALQDELLKVDVFRKRIKNITLYPTELFPNGYKNTNTLNIVRPKAYSEHEPWFKETLAKNGRVCWYVFVNEYSQSMVSAAKVIFNPQNPDIPLALLRIDIDILTFTKNIDNLVIGRTGKVFLIKGTQIIRQKNEGILKAVLNSPDFYEALGGTAPKNGVIKTDGKEYSLIYDEIDNTGIIICGIVPLSELLESAVYVRNVIVITVIVSILIALFLSYIVSNLLTKPILSLSHEMENYERSTDSAALPAAGNELYFLIKSFSNMKHRINKLLHENKKLYERQKILELKALQAQINPHFLYNTLDSINWMAQKQNTPEISNIVSALGTFFRNSLNKGKEFITLRKELEQVTSYVTIQKLRLKDKFDLVLEVGKELYNIAFLKLTLQPLIENCIVHGFSAIDYKGIITIKAYEKDGYVFIEVADNGCGADSEMLNDYIYIESDSDEKIDRYGSRNVNQRIKIYFGDDCGLSFSEPGEGLKATVKIKRIENIYENKDIYSR